RRRRAQLQRGPLRDRGRSRHRTGADPRPRAGPGTHPRGDRPRRGRRRPCGARRPVPGGPVRSGPAQERRRRPLLLRAAATPLASRIGRPVATVRERWADARGSMTILTTGVLVVILMVIAVGTSITGVQLERNGLQHAADSAALAASQAVDPARIYS